MKIMAKYETGNKTITITCRVVNVNLSYLFAFE